MILMIASVVEYIIVLAIIAMVLAVGFPGLREKLSNNLNETLGTTVNTKPETTPTPVETAQATHDSFQTMTVMVGIGATVGVLLLIAIVAWIVMKVKDKPIQENLNKMLKEKEMQESVTWESLWSQKDVLTKEAQNYIISIQKKISTLIPLLTEQGMKEDLHTVMRMEDTELFTLLQNYLNLTDIQKKLEITRLEMTLRSMEQELDHTQHKLDKMKKDNFEQTVRVIETRYDEEPLS